MSLAWQIEFTPRAKKHLNKIDRKDAVRIVKKLESIAQSNQPRAIGKALKSEKFQNLWRYRVGDYRILCQIEDGQHLILAVALGHRKNIYP